MQQKLLSQFQQDMPLRGLGVLTQQAYLSKVQKYAEFFGISPRAAKSSGGSLDTGDTGESGPFRYRR